MDHWLSVAYELYVLHDELKLNTIDEHLLLNSFFVGSSMTIADVAIFYSVSKQLKSVEGRANLKRWFKLIQSRVNASNKIEEGESVTIFFNSQGNTNGTSSSVKASESKPKSEGTKESKVPKEKQLKAPTEKAEPDSGVLKEKTKSKAESKNVPSIAELNPMKLDLRVGVILRCWEHPEAEKLLCEEIDVGEEKPRQIASGLRAHYSASEMEGQRVVVLANLKERPMVGFKSQGMVMCSCNDDHSVIKLVNPPSTAKPGDRITFEGFEGEPATPNEMVKKKLLENLSPYFRTDENGVANWNGVPFGVAGSVCFSENKNGTVS